MSDHAAFKTWAILVIGSMAFSGLLVSVDSFMGGGVIGYAIYDTGPDVEFNPDYIGEADLGRNIFAGAAIMFLLLIIQIGVYLGISKYYSGLEEQQ